ncbi:hypothetical protein ONS95_005866 [Cadophora gregata]|uniref:uncharacterized protein n=1 Tax=Cadophora gregata TaxID=51156 RepID=UPI0026DB0475|nr:uncharacterized protein ONS95_005866 [Cadophora gregata]KAK0102243.1 hypothetical protein ONS95_005866 [Cadophora gregata]
MARLEFIGGSSKIYRLNPFILVKVPREKGDEEAHALEQAAFDIIERYGRFPNLVTSFYRAPGVTFLESAGTNLQFILQQNQTRDPKTRRVLSASSDYPIHWRTEISGACAWLEQIGLAHCDLRPENIVIDGDHAKVIDFDHSVHVDSPLDIGTEPFARKLVDGSYGLAGPVTELFAIGSILFCLTRGYQPYENEWFGKGHRIHMGKLLQNREFPQLDTHQWDTVISCCWEGKFRTVEELHSEIESLTGQVESTPVLDQNTLENHREECEQAVKDGLIRSLVEHLA